MTSQNLHQIYGRLLRQELEHSKSGHTHTQLTQTIETVNDGVKQPKESSCQDADFQDKVWDSAEPSDHIGDAARGSHLDDSPRCDQQEGKAYRHNQTAVFTLVGSFVIMSIVSLVASILFPTPSAHDYTTTVSEDITPIIAPMHTIGVD